MADSVLIIAILLGIGFLATRLAPLLRLPHSVFLVLLGIAAGFVLARTGHGVPDSVWNGFPGIILYVLLPPLVFESAYHINFADLRRDLVPVTALAVAALAVSTGLIGLGLHALLAIPYPAGLLFGALISATDPVAVVALFKEIGAPRRLSMLLEGESLLNDGTAIVLYSVLAEIVFRGAGHAHLLLYGTGAFLRVALGGILVGLAVVLVASLLLRATTEVGAAQVGLTVAFAYISFILADHVFHVSGVMSTMTVGMYLGNRARLELSGEALRGMHSLWEFVALSCNTLVFLAVGLAVNPETLARAFVYLPAMLLVVYLARALSVAGTLLPLNLWSRMERISAAYQAVLIWGGLRGGLALALVFLLPQDFAYKHLFLAMAGAVVLFSLLVNALTLAPLMQRLGLMRLSRDEQHFYALSLQEVLQRVFAQLARAAGSGALSAQLVSDLRQRSLAPLEEAAEVRQHAAHRYETQRMLLAEQQYYNRQLEDQVLSQRAYLRLSRLVAERLELFQGGAADRLRDFAFEGAFRRKARWPWLPRRRSVQDLATTFEILLHLEFGLSEAERALDQEGEAAGLLRRWKHAAHGKLEEFYKAVPHLGVAVQSQFMARSVGASSRHALEELAEADVISDAVYARALDMVDHLHADVLQDARRRLHPSLADLLASIPLFQGLPQSGMEMLLGRVRVNHHPAGSAVVKEGSEGSSLFLVLSGILEVQGTQFADPERRPRLFAGSFFGEMSLLFGTPRRATVMTLVESQLAEIDRELFLELSRQYPVVQEEVARIAAARMSAKEPETVSFDQAD
ncbi:MAG TPA: cation:proton antiporter [Terriglobales bacterium]|nr:cation:proton antiporter [Terriglobales bacterium]